MSWGSWISRVWDRLRPKPSKPPVTPPPVVTPPVVVPPVTPPVATTYTVKSGDTLSGIAKSLGVTLAALVAANPQVTNPDVIEVGQVLNVPSGGSTPPVVTPPVVTPPVVTPPVVTPPSPTPTSWVNSAAINEQTAVSYNKYTGGGTVASWIAAACKARGITSASAVANWTKGYQTAISRESSGDANACNRNDSNNTTPPGYSKVADYGYGYPGGWLNGALTNYQCSRGCAQCIPQTFAANHCPGTSNNIYDPVANIAASMGYVVKTYKVATDGSNLAQKVQQFDPNRSPAGY